jgi:hypothetical protein
MGSMIFKVIAFISLISAVCAQHSLYFTNVPDTGVVVGEHYNVDWTGGDYSSVMILYHYNIAVANTGNYSL